MTAIYVQSSKSIKQEKEIIGKGWSCTLGSVTDAEERLIHSYTNVPGHAKQS